MMNERKAMELAAQCWCEPETSHLIMEPLLAAAFAKVILEVTGASCLDEGCPHYGTEHSHPKMEMPEGLVIDSTDDCEGCQ